MAEATSRHLSFPQALRNRARISWLWFITAGLLMIGGLATLLAAEWRDGTSSGTAQATLRLMQGASTIDGEGWSVRQGSAIDLTRDVLLLAPEDLSRSPTQPGGLLFAIDPDSGSVTASFELGYSPVVARRASANQLLVSDIVIEHTAAGEESHARLLVFSTDDTLRLEHEIQIPNRLIYRVHRPLMALSADESRLFVINHDYWDEPASCRTGGDAALCDRISISVLALDPAPALITAADLPRDCGTPAMIPSGMSSMLISCPEGSASVTRVDGRGRLQAVGEMAGAAGLDPAPLYARIPIGLRVGVETPSGDTLAFLLDGTVMPLGDGRNDPDRERYLPGGARPVWYADPTRVDDERLAVPFTDRLNGDTLAGVAVFNLLTRRIESVHALPSGATSFAMSRSGTAVTLAPDELGLEKLGDSSSAQALDLSSSGALTANDLVIVP